MAGQTLELPPMYPAPVPDGGAGLGWPTLPQYQTRQQNTGTVLESLANMYRNRASMKRGKGSGGCCPCQAPYDQTPYQEGSQRAPSLPGGQSGPVKPFQQATSPCDVTREKLARAGLTPEELNDCLRSGGKSRATRRTGGRRRKRRVAAPRRKAKSAATVRRYRKALRASRYPTELSQARSENAELKALAKSLGISTSVPKKRGRRKVKGSGRTVGSYRLLSNGACYDPSTGKFVKRSNCGK
jgi:hypothetical protein